MSGNRLETVVRVEELRERIERGRVAAARRTTVERRRARDRAADVLDDLAGDPPRDAARILGYRRLLEGGGRELAAADDAVAQARTDAARALDDWGRAARRREGVERLDERLRSAARDHQARRAAAEIDDLNVTRWRRRTEDAEPTDDAAPADHAAPTDRRMDDNP